MRLFETRTVKDSEGNCTDHIWCGYCKCCKMLFSCSPHTDIEEWRKEQFLYGKRQEKRKIELEREALLEIGDNIPHYWLMCSFDENEHSPKDVEKMLLEITTKYDLDSGIASIEYYSNKNPEGGHLHFHLLAPKNKKYKPCTIIDYVQKITKLKRNFIDLKQHNTNSFTNRVNYVCGYKKNEKQEFINNDRIWRENQDLPHIYLQFTESLRKKYKEPINHALR